MKCKLRPQVELGKKGNQIFPKWIECILWSRLSCVGCEHFEATFDASKLTLNHEGNYNCPYCSEPLVVMGSAFCPKCNARAKRVPLSRSTVKEIYGLDTDLFE